jgi:hypothetical protein
MMLRNPRLLLGHAAVFTLLLVLGWMRLQSADLRRPFEVDELLTVRYYTWVGVQPSGEQRPLNHIDDYYALERPGARQLAMGVYCSLGRWPEPNNHVLNSLLANGSIALGHRDELSARVPALLGGLVFAGALYYLCAGILRWRMAAPLVVLWAWFAPYVVMYSQVARGYTWMLALQALLIIGAYLMARTARSVTLGALGVLAATLSLMNVVSTAVDWVIPYYAALLLVRPHPPGAEEPSPEANRAWRRYVLVQALCVASMGSIFFISHLPSLYASAQQYGLEYHSAGEFVEVASRIVDELFPGFAAKAFAAAGAAGLVVLGVSRQQKFLVTLVVLVCGATLLHCLLTRKFPYARALGQIVPLVLLGAAYLTERLIGIYESTPARALVFGAVGLLSLIPVALSWGQPRDDGGLSECLALARQVEPAAGAESFVPIRSYNDYLVSLYGPRAWRRIDVVSPGRKLDVMLFSQDLDGAGAVPGSPRVRGYRLTHLSGETRPLADEGSVPPEAWVFWYPDFTMLGVSAKEQDAYVQGSGCRVMPQHARYQVKFDIYSYLQCYIFISKKNDTEARKIAEVVREGLRRYGGRAVVFVPVMGALP